MKLIDVIIILFSLFSFIKSTCSSEEEEFRIRDTDDCTKRTFSVEEIEEGAYKCCLMREEIDTQKQDGKRYSCIALTHIEYDDIKHMIKTYESNAYIDDVKIKCKTSYLHYGLFSLFLILFAYLI